MKSLTKDHVTKMYGGADV